MAAIRGWCGRLVVPIPRVEVFRRAWRTERRARRARCTGVGDRPAVGRGGVQAPPRRGAAAPRPRGAHAPARGRPRAGARAGRAPSRGRLPPRHALAPAQPLLVQHELRRALLAGRSDVAALPRTRAPWLPPPRWQEPGSFSGCRRTRRPTGAGWGGLLAPQAARRARRGGPAQGTTPWACPLPRSISSDPAPCTCSPRGAASPRRRWCSPTCPAWPGTRAGGAAAARRHAAAGRAHRAGAGGPLLRPERLRARALSLLRPDPRGPWPSRCTGRCVCSRRSRAPCCSRRGCARRVSG